MRPQMKSTVVMYQKGVTNGATVTANLDTLEYDWLTLDVVMSTSNAVTNNPSALKLGESDDTVATNFADIAKFVGDGASGFTIPNADTSNPQVVKFNIDLRGRKRYLRLTATPVTTQDFIGVANLGRGDEAFDAATTEVAALVEG